MQTNNHVTKQQKPQRQTNDQALERKNKQKIIKQARKKARIGKMLNILNRKERKHDKQNNFVS